MIYGGDEKSIAVTVQMLLLRDPGIEVGLPFGLVPQGSRYHFSGSETQDYSVWGEGFGHKYKDDKLSG